MLKCVKPKNARDATATVATIRCPKHIFRQEKKTSLKTSCIDNARCEMMKMVENLRQNFSSGGNQCIVLGVCAVSKKKELCVCVICMKRGGKAMKYFEK